MRKELILRVAFEKFAQKGYNASLSEIADEVGIKKQTLYNYFSNKDELMYEMIKNELLQYFNEKKEEISRLNELKSEEKLKEIFFSIMRYFSCKSKLRFWRWLMFVESEEILTECSKIITSHELPFITLLENIFIDGIENGEIVEQPVEALVHTFIALIHGTLDGRFFYDRVVNSKTFTTNVWGTFWIGISLEK